MIEFAAVDKGKIEVVNGTYTIAKIMFYTGLDGWAICGVRDGMHATTFRLIADKLDELNGVSDESRG